MKYFHNKGEKTTDTVKIRMLLRAIDLGSFTSAANEYNYSPSAFSHIADNIENELKIKIIKRTNFGIELTNEGKTVVKYLSAMLNKETELKEYIKESNSKNESITIGTYSSIAQEVLPEIIKRFKEQNPQVEIKINVESSFEENVGKTMFDIIFADKEMPHPYKSIKLWEEKYVKVFSETYKSDKKPLFIMPQDSFVENWINKNDYKDIIYVSSSDDNSVLQMIKKGIGISVLPSLAVKGKSENLIISETKPLLTRTVYMSFLTKGYGNNSKTEQKFVKFVKNEL